MCERLPSKSACTWEVPGTFYLDASSTCLAITNR
jgi:hypothetical protein